MTYYVVCGWEYVLWVDITHVVDYCSNDIQMVSHYYMHHSIYIKCQT